MKLRDDKQYLVLRLVDPVVPSESEPLHSGPAAASPDTPKRDVFPRVQVVRNIRDDAAHYFGPYHSATSARETLRILNRHFQLRTCTDHVLETRGRPCLQYQIKRCSGPCAIDVPPAQYAEQVEDVKMFLQGKSAELVGRLRGRMQARAAAEDFESAAALRDGIGAVERTLAKQHVVQDDFVDQDVWGLFREADVVEVSSCCSRPRRQAGGPPRVPPDQPGSSPDAAVIGGEHVQQYYASGTLVPDEVVVGVDLEGSDTLADWLATQRGRKLRLVEPRRGTRVRLVELADRNAEASAASRKGKTDDAAAQLAKVGERLGLSRPPHRIECYDIAHIQGTEPVAAMVTFVDGAPARGLYRKFRIRTSSNDDFASMYEVLTRRFRRKSDGPADDPAWARPDLVVIDGGKGQLAMAVAALTDLGVPLGGETGVEVIGLAKERELEAGSAPDRIYRRNVKDAIALRPNSPELYVLARIRDEAHRFANSFHRDRRGKPGACAAKLDDIAGASARRAASACSSHSPGSARDAHGDDRQLSRAAPGMTRRAADEIARYFAEQPKVETDEPDEPEPDDLDDAATSPSSES